MIQHRCSLRHKKVGHFVWQSKSLLPTIHCDRVANGATAPVQFLYILASQLAETVVVRPYAAISQRSSGSRSPLKLYWVAEPSERPSDRSVLEAFGTFTRGSH